MELEKRLLELLSNVRPEGIEVDAYPQIVSLLLSVVTLELTKK